MQFPAARDGAVQTPEDGVAKTRGLKARDRIILALVLASTFLAYIRTLGFQFVFDDRPLIIENPLLRSWRFLPSYFTQHLPPLLSPTLPGNYYRPMVLLWLRFNYMLFGLRPEWWHFTTLALHLVVTMSVYLLARRILKNELAAGVTAAIFGLHPVHVEAVAWAMGVTELLLGALFIPSILCYLNAREARPKARAWYAFSLLLYGLAMLAKETALVLPLILLAYEWIFRARSAEFDKAPARGQNLRAVILRAAPFLALTGIYLIVRAIALRGLVASVSPLSISARLLTCPSVVWFYVRLLLWPFGLSAFYDKPYVTAPGLSNFLLPVLALAGTAFGLARWAWRSPAVAFATATLVLPILPVLNFSVFLEGEIAHDRYLYLPSVGFALLVAIAIRRAGMAEFRKKRAVASLPALSLVTMLGLATFLQSRYWASNLDLYRRGVTVAPHNNLARNNLAIELTDLGHYSDAVNLYRQTLADKPDYWLSNYNLGFTYYKLGQLEQAERWLRRAIEISPTDPDQFVYLGLTLLKMGRLDDAAASIRRALSIRPQGAGYHFALGVVLKMKGDLPGALEEFKAELANDPQQKAAREQIKEIETDLRALR